MNHYKCFIVLSILSLFSYSCISYIQVEKTIPPEIILYDTEMWIQYITLFDAKHLDLENEKRLEINITGVEKIKEGVIQSFVENEEFDLYYFDSIFFAENPSSNYKKPLSVDSVKYFCSFNNTPLLLTHDTYSVYYDKELESYENEEGKIEKTAYYYLVIDAGFSLYDSTGYLIDRSIISNRKYIDSRFVIINLLNLSFRPSFANRGEDVNQMSLEIGKSYINKFYPTYKMEGEKYYTNKYFAEVTPYMKSQDWEKVIELLTPLANSNNPKISKKAAYNLSTVYKALYDQEKSDQWMERSK